MAAAIKTALAESKTPLGPPSANPPPPPAIDLDTAKLDEITGIKGNATGGVYQFGVSHGQPATEGGMQVNTPMGGANAINFQPTGGGKAAITERSSAGRGTAANWFARSAAARARMSSELG